MHPSPSSVGLHITFSIVMVGHLASSSVGVIKDADSVNALVLERLDFAKKVASADKISGCFKTFLHLG